MSFATLAGFCAVGVIFNLGRERGTFAEQGTFVGGGKRDHATATAAGLLGGFGRAVAVKAFGSEVLARGMDQLDLDWLSVALGEVCEIVPPCGLFLAAEPHVTRLQRQSALRANPATAFLAQSLHTVEPRIAVIVKR